LEKLVFCGKKTIQPMKKIAILLVLVFFGILSKDQIFAQKGDIASVVTHKWKVIWFSDDGVEKNMLEKKQQLVLRADGTGEMSMMGEKVGPVTWTVAEGKDRITFQDDPIAPPYVVKVSKYKNGKNMLFTGELPNGTIRKVYFEMLSGK
jgi:hypothetical protein